MQHRKLSRSERQANRLGRLQRWGDEHRLHVRPAHEGLAERFIRMESGGGTTAAEIVEKWPAGTLGQLLQELAKLDAWEHRTFFPDALEEAYVMRLDAMSLTLSRDDILALFKAAKFSNNEPESQTLYRGAFGADPMEAARLGLSWSTTFRVACQYALARKSEATANGERGVAMVVQCTAPREAILFSHLGLAQYEKVVDTGLVGPIEKIGSEAAWYAEAALHRANLQETFNKLIDDGDFSLRDLQRLMSIRDKALKLAALR